MRARAALVALVLALPALAVAGPAVAEWDASGTGTASAVARQLGPVTLTATPGVQQASLSWTAETASGVVTGYRVLRWNAATGGTSTAACPAALTSTATTCTDTGLALGTYWYTVEAAYTAPGQPAPTWTGPATARQQVLVAGAPAVVPGTPDLLAASDSGASSTDDLTNVVLPTFTGTGANGSTVQLLVGGQVVGTGAVSGGTYSITLTTALAPGARVVTARYSTALAPSSPGLTVTIDTTAPVVTIAVMPTGNSGGGSLTGSSTASDPTPTVTVVNAAAAPQTVGALVRNGATYSVSYSLARGARYTATVRQTDLAGNTGTASVAFDN